MEAGLRAISSRELTEWMAFYELEPFGDERADLQAGIVASTVANANRDAKKRRRPFRPADFMPRFGEAADKPTQSWQEQLGFVERLNAAIGGKDLRKKREGE